MKLAKYSLIVIAVLFTAVGGFGLLTYRQMQEIPEVEPATQIDARVYDDRFRSAIETSREELNQARTDLKAPALSLAVSVDGKIIWAEARGIVDLDTKEPVTLKSRFAIGSVSKTLTATAAALLVENGKLDLDADVRTYVPSFPEKQHLITTRQLLSHQAGIRHYGFALNPPVFSDSALNKQFDSVTDSLSLFAEDDLLFEPDTSFNYSTYGYTLVSAALEGASGEAFLDLLQTTLFDPLGLSDTSADFSDRPVENRVSDYVQLYPGADVLRAPAVNVSYKWAGGGIASTPIDLAKFGSALLSGEIVSPQTLEMMFTPRQLKSGELNPQHYGLGWRVGGMYYPRRSETIITLINHGGTATGGVAILLLLPDSGLVVAMCANASGNTGSGALTSKAAAIARTFLDAMSQSDDRQVTN